MQIKEYARVLSQHMLSDNICAKNFEMQDRANEFQELSDDHTMTEMSGLDNVASCPYQTFFNSDELDHYSTEIANNNATYSKEMNDKHEESFSKPCPTVNNSQSTCMTSKDEVQNLLVQILCKIMVHFTAVRMLSRIYLNRRKECINTLAFKNGKQEKFLCKDIAETSKSRPNQFDDISKSSSDLMTKLSCLLHRSTETIEDKESSRKWTERLRAPLKLN